MTGDGRDRSYGPIPAAPGSMPAAPRLIPAAPTADRLVAAVRDDPVGRLRLAATFYDQRAGGRSIRAYRRAEVAFMRWQLRCGVLSPLDAPQPGSPWWRAVNESLLRDAVEADLLCDGAPGEATSRGVELWLTFLHRPTPLAWYRAHNASIVAGYLRHRDLVAAEGPLERFFMDVALLRVLYAQCLLIAPRLALGRLAVLGRFLGDPRYRGADLFLSLQDVLPDTYPLAASTIDQVLADDNYLGRIIDYGVIAPRIGQFYQGPPTIWVNRGSWISAPTTTRSTPGRTNKATSGAPTVPRSRWRWSARWSARRPAREGRVPC